MCCIGGIFGLKGKIIIETKYCFMSILGTLDLETDSSN